MKINIPVIRAVRVGTAINYGTDRYYDDNRPNVYSETIESPIVEFKVQSLNVLDYDFESARRSAAAGRALLVSACAVTVIPAVGTFALVAAMGVSLFSALREWFGEAAYFVKETHELIVDGVVSHIKEALR
jgi:hypothetical protein